MLLIGYSRAASAGTSAASITALAAQAATNPSSPLFGGTAAAHDFTQDLTAVPNGARCLVVGWGWENSNSREFGNFWLDGVTQLAPLIKTFRGSSSDGTKRRIVAIGQWTKNGETSATFTTGFSGTIQGCGFQLFYMQNVHASTVTATGSGTAAGAGSIALASALSTAANGVALFACAQGKGGALTGDWSVTPVEETDQSVEQYLRIHAASYRTTGASLNPTLTFSGTMDDACMAAVAIPPA